MRCYIKVKGREQKHPCDYTPDDDYFLFNYYRRVFDEADSFKCVSVYELAGGTENNGVTDIKYEGKHGSTVQLEIDGGFPVPELASMSFSISDISSGTVEDIIAAFGKYHETDIKNFKVESYGQREVSIILYTDDDTVL